jgi:tetratricopeptide (TPR) repeat protein
MMDFRERFLQSGIWGISVSLIFLSVGCASVKKAFRVIDNPSLATARQETQVPKLYRQGLEQLENGEDKAAIASFEQMQIEEPASSYTQVAIFNSARAYENLGDCKNAIERYRQVSRSAERLAPRLQALALYTMSFCFETLGQDTETVASLNDAYARISQLPVEIARAELPARLASAYARAGNFAQAQSYYHQAEAGVAQLRRNIDRKEVPEWLPRTLYFMGHLSFAKIPLDEFEVTLRPLAQSQIYLLQAAELGSDQHLNQWSKKAGDELMQNYRDIWKVFENDKPGKEDDAVLARGKLQKERWVRAQIFYDYLKKMEDYRLPPEKPSNEKVKAIYILVKDLKGRLNQILSEPSVTGELTPDAQRRLERVRGRVLNPDDSLERSYQNPKKLPRKKIIPRPKSEIPTPTEPPPQMTPIPQIDVKDPNI